METTTAIVQQAHGLTDGLHSSEPQPLEIDELSPRYVLDALPVAIYMTDPEGRLTYFNPAATEFSGRVPELGSDSWCVTWKLYYPDGTPMPHDECPMAIALKEGRVVRGVEAIAERPDGTRTWFTPYPTPLRDAQGRIVGGISLLVDITQRKEAEKLAAILPAIVESSDDAIITKDLQSTITSWNKSAERLFGYTAEEAIGQSILMLIPPDRQQEEPEILSRITRGERVEHFETVRVRKDGSMVDISLTISPVRDSAGRVIGASKIARDITERKQAQAEREEHIAEIESLNEQLKRAMAETHHRVKNNLQVVSALVDMQAMTYNETIPRSEILRIGQHIRALALIHDILTLQGKSANGGQFLNTKEVMAKLAPLIQTLVGDRLIRFDVEELDLPLRQGTTLAVLVSELASNAVKHGAGGIHVKLAAVGDRARLQVCDEGPGFPPGFDHRVAANTGLELIDTLARTDLLGTTAFQNGPSGGALVTVEFPRLTHAHLL